MAVLTSAQAKLCFQDGACGRTALYALKNVNAGDTFDVAPIFSKINRGGIVSDTGTTIGAVTISGTVITIPAGPATDGIWALLVGIAGDQS